MWASLSYVEKNQDKGLMLPFGGKRDPSWAAPLANVFCQKFICPYSPSRFPSLLLPFPFSLSPHHYLFPSQCGGMNSSVGAVKSRRPRFQSIRIWHGQISRHCLPFNKYALGPISRHDDSYWGYRGKSRRQTSFLPSGHLHSSSGEQLARQMNKTITYRETCIAESSYVSYEASSMTFWKK